MKQKTKDLLWYYTFTIPAGVSIYMGVRSVGCDILIAMLISVPLVIVVAIAFLVIRDKIRGG